MKQPELHSMRILFDAIEDNQEQPENELTNTIKAFKTIYSDMLRDCDITKRECEEGGINPHIETDKTMLHCVEKLALINDIESNQE